MVREACDGGAVVRLSGTNWLYLLGTIIGTGVAQAVLLYGRLIALETTVEQHGRQLVASEQHIELTRSEFIAEIRALRQEIKQKL